MEFFCYHRDRVGSTGLREELQEEHWAYMDQFDSTMIARGPTFLSDGTLTGSVHILDLPDPATARAFAFEEPCYQAGAYRDALVRRWHNRLGRTMWDYAGESGNDRYLVLGFTSPSAPSEAHPRSADRLADRLIALGPLLSDDGSFTLGAAALVEASGPEEARSALEGGRYDGVEVHQWRPGGRPA